MRDRAASDIALTIRTRARQRRLGIGLSLQRLADRAGLTKAHVWEVERGTATNPTLSTIVGLSAGLGVSVEWLMGLDGAPSTRTTEIERPADHGERDG